MHVTLHLTTGCNMFCKYCYSPPRNRNDMSEQIAFHSIDYIAKEFPLNTGIIFFGGEPLLKKDLIIKSIEYAKHKEKEENCNFHYKVTTNGILLDNEFLEFAKLSDLQISISIDGIEKAHDYFRKLKNGQPTWAALQSNIDLLLKYQPYAKVLITVSPETIDYYSASVEYLIEKGFRYIIASLNYAGKWTDNEIKKLKIQYKKIAEIYKMFTLKEKKIYFSPFDMKLAIHIRNDNLQCFQCHLGKRQISISHDGKIYPCVQFVQDGFINTDFIMGDIWKGIDALKQDELYDLSKQQHNECLECDYNSRCNNKCSCLNWQLTGTVNELSPKICEAERILIPIVDKLGESLFKSGTPIFIQKHYNAVYPILSMIEDLY